VQWRGLDENWLPPRLLWILTSCTLGHSVTLSLAMLGVVHVPLQPVEAGNAHLPPISSDH